MSHRVLDTVIGVVEGLRRILVTIDADIAAQKEATVVDLASLRALKQRRETIAADIARHEQTINQ